MPRDAQSLQEGWAQQTGQASQARPCTSHTSRLMYPASCKLGREPSSKVLRKIQCWRHQALLVASSMAAVVDTTSNRAAAVQTRCCVGYAIAWAPTLQGIYAHLDFARHHFHCRALGRHLVRLSCPCRTGLNTCDLSAHERLARQSSRQLQFEVGLEALAIWARRESIVIKFEKKSRVFWTRLRHWSVRSGAQLGF